MKTFAIAGLLAALSTTPVIAQDMSRLSFGGEVDSEYNVDSEVFDVTLTPKATFSLTDSMNASVASDLTVWNNGTDFTIVDHMDTLPTLDFEVVHTMSGGWALNAEVAYDLENEARGDLTIGPTFSF